MASIYYDKRMKSYRAMIIIDGKRFTKRFKSKDDAEKWIISVQNDVNEGTFIEPSNMSLGDWCEQYLEIYAKPNVRPKTLMNYYNEYNHIPDKEKRIKVQNITTLQLQNMLNNLDTTQSNKQRIHRFLRQVFRKAVNVGIIKKSPMDAVERPRYHKAEIETFTLFEVRHILNWCLNDDHYCRYYPLLLLASTTGCRIGELLGLKIHNVGTDSIRINNSIQEIKGGLIEQTPKTDAGIRTISVPSKVIDWLLIAFSSDGVKSEYVFHTSSGKPLTPSNVETNWRRILKYAGISHKHFHALRHTHATELLASGIPLLEVSRRLGHLKVSHTLDLYGHRIKDYDKKISKKIEEMYT